MGWNGRGWVVVGWLVGWLVVYLLIYQCDVLVPFPVVAAASTYCTYSYLYYEFSYLLNFHFAFTLHILLFIFSSWISFYFPPFFQFFRHDQPGMPNFPQPTNQPSFMGARLCLLVAAVAPTRACPAHLSGPSPDVPLRSTPSADRPVRQNPHPQRPEREHRPTVRPLGSPPHPGCRVLREGGGGGGGGDPLNTPVTAPHADGVCPLASTERP